MLSRGGEVATSREVYELRGGARRLPASWAPSPSSSGCCPSSSSSRSACDAWRGPSRRPCATTTSEYARRPARPGSERRAAPHGRRSTSLPTRSPTAAVYAMRAAGGRGRRWRWSRRAPPSSTWAASRPARAPTRCPERGDGPGAPGGRSAGRRCPAGYRSTPTRPRVAAKALEAGAYMINDISALRMDPEMVAVVRDADCPVILMHMLGEPKTMQAAPVYGDVVARSTPSSPSGSSGRSTTASRRATCSSIRAWASARHGAQPGAPARPGEPALAGAAGSAGGLAQTVPRRDTRHLPDGEPTGDGRPRSSRRCAAAQRVSIIRVHDVRVNAQAIRMARAVLAGRG